MRAEIVDAAVRSARRLSACAHDYQQIVIERIGMIEVCDLTIVERQILQVAVIRILLNEDDFARAAPISRMRFATVVLPEPVPPEMPMIKLTKCSSR